MFLHQFKLSLDVSDTGAGAVLLQDGDNDVEYFSKKFNWHQFCKLTNFHLYWPQSYRFCLSDVEFEQ